MTKTLISIVCALSLAACSEEVMQRPVSNVVVDKVVSRPYQPKREYVGRLEARDDVAIQAKITGYLISRDFREGELVQAGSLLYALETSEFDAAIAMAKADVNARMISYLEAHGTGTQLGDPIEMTGLSQAFSTHTKDTGFCAIGSVKSNIGHLEAAAGIAGIIKIVLKMIFYVSSKKV